jgi:hypothetical protein
MDDTKPEPEATEQGAPTDAAHQAAGDGTLTGTVPAGLTTQQMLEKAEDIGHDDGGTG